MNKTIIKEQIKRLKRFVRDYKIWDTEDFSQSNMVEELISIIENLQGRLWRVKL